MRLADAVFRGGHLSDDALVEVWMTGQRPVHLDRCSSCSERVLQLGRWLDDTRTSANDAADAAFPAERLAAQQAQILRRLEQVDQPSRVIAFPAQSRPQQRSPGRSVQPAWIGIAAAAGVLLGLASGQLTFHLAQKRQVQPPQAAREVVPAAAPVAVASIPQTDVDDAMLLEGDFTRVRLGTLSAIDDATPRAADLVLVSRRR